MLPEHQSLTKPIPTPTVAGSDCLTLNWSASCKPAIDIDNSLPRSLFAMPKQGRKNKQETFLKYLTVFIQVNISF